MKHMRFAFGIVTVAVLILAGCGQQNNTSGQAGTEETAAAQSQPYSMEDVAYIQPSEKSFDDLVAAIETAAADNKFTVLQKHNLQKSLGEKGFEMTPYTIIEVCNGKFAHTILSDTKEAGMFLPCRIAVYEDGGKNYAAMMKPSLIGDMMPDADFGTIPQDVESILVNVITTAVQ